MRYAASTVALLLCPFLSVVKGLGEGRNFRATFSKTPIPFSIDVDRQFIEETKQRVALTRFPTEIQGQPDLAEGPTLHNATAVKNFWANEYDWFDIQATLNEQ